MRIFTMFLAIIAAFFIAFVVNYHVEGRFGEGGSSV